MSTLKFLEYIVDKENEDSKAYLKAKELAGRVVFASLVTYKLGGRFEDEKIDGMMYADLAYVLGQVIACSIAGLKRPTSHAKITDVIQQAKRLVRDAAVAYADIEALEYDSDNEPIPLSYDFYEETRGYIQCTVFNLKITAETDELTAKLTYNNGLDIPSSLSDLSEIYDKIKAVLE